MNLNCLLKNTITVFIFTLTLFCLVSCSPGAGDSGASLVSRPSAGNTFFIPKLIVASIEPYSSIEAALQDETKIDWTRDKVAARAITVAYAAKELQDHLLSVGIDAKISTSLPLTSQSAIVLVTKDAEKKFKELIPVDLPSSDVIGEQAYAVTPYKERIYITANERVGLLYGVYDLLEQIGFSWYDPYETLKPDAAILNSKIAWSQVLAKPKIDLRGFWIYGDGVVPKEFAVWMARNKLNVGGQSNSYLQRKLGIKGWGGEHNLLQEEFSKSEIFEANPEWYSIHSGVRRPVASAGTYFNPSFASLEAANYFADRMIERLERGDLKNIDILNIWPTDASSNLFDQSPQAKALGNETDNLLYFYANVLARFRQANSDKRLSRPVTVAGISYFLTMQAPTNKTVIDRLVANDYLHLFYPINRDWSGRIDSGLQNRDENRKILQDMESWMRVGKLKYGVVEYHNMSSYSALGLSDQVFFSDNLSVMTTGRSALYAYMHPNLNNPGARRLTNRLLARLTWENSNDLNATAQMSSLQESLALQFFQQRYGADAKDWQLIHNTMALSVDNAKAIFGSDSLSWMLFQKFLWSDPPYSATKALEHISQFRGGGVQEIPVAFSGGTTTRANFRGLDESIKMQTTLKPLWQEILNRGQTPEVRRRMEDDVAWFDAASSRYRLMVASCDFALAEQNSLITAEFRDRIRFEVDLLGNSPTTNDTLSPVNQRAFLNLHKSLAGLP